MSARLLQSPPAGTGRSALERLRNLGIVAHIDSGKTTVTERMLKVSGKIRVTGEVHNGQATMDFLKEEQERGITIGSAATHFSWGGCELNLIDTPGHVDFTAEVERSLRVLDGAVLAIDSVAGAQAQSETVNRQLDKYGVPRLVFVNKLDRVGANFGGAVASVRSRLGLNAAAIQLPIGEGAEFRGLVDLVSLQQINFPAESDDPAVFTHGPVEDDLVEAVRQARYDLLEALSIHSDELTEILLEEGEPPHELVVRVLREATIRHGFVPCLAGAALRNRGIPALLDAVVAYLPSPADMGAVRGRDPSSGDEKCYAPEPSAPLGAIVFKTVHFSTGDLTFVRLYSGTLNAGETVYNSRLGKNERIGRLFRVHAASREALERATAGEIVACMGLKQSVTGDSLCSKKDPIVYAAATFASPVISVAVEPVSSVDRDRLGEVLGIIAREDPTFRAETDRETGQTLISGMGELHLEVVAHRIRDEFRVAVKCGAPRVALRQTLRRAETLEARHIKQTGGSGQYAVATVEFEPIDAETVEFVDRITGGKISKEFLAALERGIRDHFASGGKRGAQIQGVRATVVDGKMHDVDSSQIAFYACGVLAAQMAEERCGTVVLEPIMRVEVATPEEYLGTVLGDLNARRGNVVEIGDESGAKKIIVRVPLMELSAYATSLRSQTSGRGDYSMEPESYRPVPESVLREIDRKR